MTNIPIADEIFARASSIGHYDAGGIFIDMRKESDILVISCSGNVPDKVSYAMENSTRRMETAKLFISDKNSLWYYNGIEGLTSSFDDTVSVVRSLVDKLKPRISCAVGTSGGGYMALALAAKLNLNRALALSPQTIINAAWRTENNDLRWDNKISQIHSSVGPEVPYQISNLIDKKNSYNNGQHTEYFVIHPTGDALDALHAKNIEGRSNTHIFSYETEDHNVSAALMHAGKLGEILDTFICDDIDQIKTRFTNILESKVTS